MPNYFPVYIVLMRPQKFSMFLYVCLVCMCVYLFTTVSCLDNVVLLFCILFLLINALPVRLFIGLHTVCLVSS